METTFATWVELNDKIIVDICYRCWNEWWILTFVFYFYYIFQGLRADDVV